jgi:hypothetical protein
MLSASESTSAWKVIWPQWQCPSHFVLLSGTPKTYIKTAESGNKPELRQGGALWRFDRGAAGGGSGQGAEMADEGR